MKKKICCDLSVPSNIIFVHQSLPLLPPLRDCICCVRVCVCALCVYVWIANGTGFVCLLFFYSGITYPSEIIDGLGGLDGLKGYMDQICLGRAVAADEVYNFPYINIWKKYQRRFLHICLFATCWLAENINEFFFVCMCFKFFRLQRPRSFCSVTLVRDVLAWLFLLTR